MLDPKAPKLSQLPMSQRIGKSLRPLLTTSKRGMSTGTFYKTMKDKFASVMPDKMAKAAALRYAVGTDTGLTDKKEKLAIKQLGKADLLAGKYKAGTNYKLGMAMHDYHAAVAANTQPKTEAKVEELDKATDPKITNAKARKAELDAKIFEARKARVDEQNKDITTSISRVVKSSETKAESKAPPMQLD
ncbi:MAG: hypothetical protein KAZ30_00095 [Candidatus Magasanikbacteria bacterium]|nr:hypothetical protein [Candidatus Magasanikbacteria bacterium]